MSSGPLSRSADLQQLLAEGYDVEIRDALLFVHHIPYVTSAKEVAFGVLVSELELAGDVTVPPRQHVAMFIGGFPCDVEGTPLAGLGNAGGRKEAAPGLFVDHQFSNKPAEGYSDYHAKITAYVSLISGPARILDPASTAQPNRFHESVDDASVFLYPDTASGPMGIRSLGAKLEQEKIAIVGVGGTGSYVLDLVAKTPVREIHLFDGDRFINHSAFRTPGAASCDDLRPVPTKVCYLSGVYGRMRRGVIPHEYYLDGETVAELRDMSFVFLCLDRATTKHAIIAKLLEWQIPFVDVGMTVEAVDGALGGGIATTLVTPAKNDHVTVRIPIAPDDDPNDDYSTRIQIAELNALNAAHAVIKWKKHLGFYRDQRREHFALYTLDVNMLNNEDFQ